jgi:DNA-binding beta-propeller fold protein YncE
MIRLNPFRNLSARPRAGCFPVLFVLAGWLALVTPLRADNPPTYLFQIDASAVPGIFYPNNIVLDSSNNLYVTDNYGNRVVKFAANGSYLTQWGGLGSGNVSPPCYGIAVDRSNNVYVADQNDHRVEKFDSNGNYLAQWGSPGTNNGQFQYPAGIAVDSSNNVYVADLGNNRIEKFDSNGNYLTQWGGLGSGNGQFASPFGIGVDRSNSVYVVDHYNQRVKKFDSNGNYLMQWGSIGTGNGQFYFPYGVAVDSSNNVYVTDINNHRIEKFDSNGNYLTQWGSYGSGNGQFKSPGGVAVDGSGNFIYVADQANDQIQVFVNNANIVPPIITRQPVSQTSLAGIAGINVTFSVSVVGTAPFAYQWTSNNVAVPGATNTTFTLTNVSLSASDSTYCVLITNNYGREWSRNARLTVLPALVTTQPPSGISATGAVLNGSVTVGPKETVVWFEWGTDTNYGNIAGATIVPGNNGSNNISAALNGLSGNVYHYRLDAANDFGIVYGDDQMFTVGFAPTVTTLAPVNSTNGSTLNATVNPEGWDTTVYFQWGTPTLTNSIPGMDIGAGVTSLNVSSFIPGLAPFTPYQYRVMASNALGTVLGKVVSWTPPFVSVSGEGGVVFTTLHSFDSYDGMGPNGLVQGSDGNFLARLTAAARAAVAPCS